MHRLETKKVTFLCVILILSLILSLGLSTFALGQTADGNEDSSFVKVPGTVPIVEVTVYGMDAVDALHYTELGFDIIGLDFDDDTYFVKIMIHGDELEYFEANGIHYEVIDDGTYVFEKSAQNFAAASLTSDADAPIQGMSHRAGTTNTTDLTVLPLPADTKIDTTGMFDPTGVLFNTRGFPERLGYRTVSEYYDEMNYLAETYPDLVRLFEYGESVEGVPLFGLEISNNPGGNDGRPSTLHMAGNHAREWISNELCLDLAWYLIAKYDMAGYEDVTELLDTTTCFFLPMTNPDGVHYDQTHNPGSWRYNRNVPLAGVDLNRNWAYGWGSANGSDSHRGAAPFSEPETASISEILRSNMVLSLISGHAFPFPNGQLVVFPWAFFINANEGDNKSDRPLMLETANNGNISIKELGRRQAQYNIHSDEYTSGMYAYSGESLDYTLGALRGLGFLYEYGRNLLPVYTGLDSYTAVAPYNGAYGEQRQFLVTYATAATAAGAGAPKTDVTAPVIFLQDTYEFSYGPSNYSTVAQVEALGEAVRGKIVVGVRPSAANDHAAIALAAQKHGAVGVIFCAGINNAQGYQYPHYNMTSLGTGTAETNNPALVTIPVCSTSKPFLREMQDKMTATSELTLKSTRTNWESIVQQFDRCVGAYMENMYFATEFAAHITGTIKDRKGNLIPEATLTLEKEIVNPTIVGNTSANTHWYNINQTGEFGQEQTATYNVQGGIFDWSVSPSKQIDNPIKTGKPIVDEGYTITVSAPGKESVIIENVEIPEYQMEIVLDIVLQSEFAELENVTPSAFVTKLNGNKNELSITVVEEYSDGLDDVFTKTFSINNNAANIYNVGPYKVYVDTKGNDQIRACYIVE